MADGVKVLTAPTLEACGRFQITANGRNHIWWLPDRETANQVHRALREQYRHGFHQGEKLRDG